MRCSGVHFCCDFECTTREPYTVYLATVEDVESGKQWIFEDMNSFIEFLSSIESSTLYFHNGINYDFNFIQWWSYQHGGFRYKLSKNHLIEFDTDEYELTKTGKVRIQNGQPVKKIIKHKLMDTTLIFAMSLKALGEIVGVEKGLGHIDTPLVREIHDDYWIEDYKDEDDVSIEERRKGKIHQSNFREDVKRLQWDIYALQDVHVLAEVIRKFNIIDYMKKRKFTIASIAYQELLTYEPYKIKIDSFTKKKEEFINATNMFAKQAYKGGISWTNPKYAGVRLKKKGFHLDYTSMYPSIYMNSEQYPLPNNMPVVLKGEEHKTNLFIIHFKNLKATCKSDRFPLLKKRTESKDDTNVDRYEHEFSGDIALTSPELEYLYENYENISYEGNPQIMYYEPNHELMAALRNHGQKWYKVKNNPKNPSERTFAKMMLNTVYGYLGFYGKEIKTYDYQFNNGVVQKILKGSDVTGIKSAEVPAAAFITAYGRVKLANDINKFGIDNVVCCDTDSLFLINFDTLEGIEGIGNELGMLKLEDTFDEIISLKPKTYCTAEQGHIVCQATAGSNYKFKSMDNFKVGELFASKEIARGVGGVGIKYVKKKLGE